MNIRNIDKFLYIRRKRQGSLTTSEETRLGSEERLNLDRLWKSDVEKIKSGELSLSNSSLAVELLDIKPIFHLI
ncbi:hypothetical protein CYANOKiyG1_05060 [Okeania sp. KiyG1]|nr:hypothetical protein CYANOKiyG1_05060 [Okeania sp. KiyG1]